MFQYVFSLFDTTVNSLNNERTLLAISYEYLISTESIKIEFLEVSRNKIIIHYIMLMLCALAFNFITI
jgi:hypothetical protein